MTNSRPISPPSPETTQSEHTEMKNPPIAPVLQRNIQKAARLAKSNLAIHVFEEKNQSHFVKLFATKSPDKLVQELNEINLNPDQLKQFQIFTSNQSEYAELFDLPPEKWMAILLEEKLDGQDLAALIGSTDMLEGAVSGRLEEIEETILDPIKKAKIFFYLNHSPDATPAEIKAFFKKIGLEDNGIIFLHHILHNVFETSVNPDLTINTKFATEGILRIKPVGSEVPAEKKAQIELDNKARLKAALRILRECVENHYNKALAKLSAAERIIMQLENDEFFAKQLDLREAKQLNHDVNGELNPDSSPELDSEADSNITFVDLENLNMASLLNSLIVRLHHRLPHESNSTNSPSLHNLSSIIILRELSNPQHFEHSPTHFNEQKHNHSNAIEPMELQSDEDKQMQDAIALSLTDNFRTRQPASRQPAHPSTRINEQKNNHRNELDDELDMEMQYAISQSLQSDNPRSRQTENKADFEEQSSRLNSKM